MPIFVDRLKTHEETLLRKDVKSADECVWYFEPDQYTRPMPADFWGPLDFIIYVWSPLDYIETEWLTHWLLE